jgi:hypothetical protein
MSVPFSSQISTHPPNQNIDPFMFNGAWFLKHKDGITPIKNGIAEYYFLADLEIVISRSSFIRSYLSDQCLFICLFLHASRWFD